MRVEIEFLDENNLGGTMWLDVSFHGCLAFAVLKNSSWQFKALQECVSAEFEHQDTTWIYLDHYTTYTSEYTRFGFSKGGKIYD